MTRQPSRASRRRERRGREYGGGYRKPVTRFSRALSQPTPRTISAADPVISRGIANPSNIPDGTSYPIADGLPRLIYGRGRESFSSVVYVVDQVHPDGVNPSFIGVQGVEIVTDSPSVEFVLKGLSQRVFLFVDGVMTNADGYTDLPLTTSFYYYKFTFASSARRRIRLVHSGGQALFGEVRIEAGHSLFDPAPARPCNMLVMGDSFWEPAFPTYAVNGLPMLLAEHLGIDQMVPAALGGTGFTNAGAGTNFAQRIAKELTLTPIDDPRFDVILFAASGNDVFDANYSTNVNACLAAARLAWPSADVIVLSQASKENLAAAGLASKEAVLEAACSTHGCTWVPGVPEALAALSSETRDSYYHVGGHPNDAGHAWLADTMNRLIRAAV